MSKTMWFVLALAVVVGVLGFATGRPPWGALARVMSYALLALLAVLFMVRWQRRV